MNDLIRQVEFVIDKLPRATRSSRVVRRPWGSSAVMTTRFSSQGKPQAAQFNGEVVTCFLYGAPYL